MHCLMDRSPATCPRLRRRRQLAGCVIKALRSLIRQSEPVDVPSLTIQAPTPRPPRRHAVAQASTPLPVFVSSVPPISARFLHRRDSSEDDDADEKEEAKIQAVSLLRPSLPKSDSAGAISTAATIQVPAHELFSARGAKPLELPPLDEYLAEIPEAEFDDPATLFSDKETDGWRHWVAGSALRRSMWRFWRRQASDADLIRSAASRAQIFPPMHLVPTHLTLADLKLNQHNAIPVLSLDTVVSAAIDGVLGAEGSTIAAAYQTIDSFKDLAQMVAIVFNFAATGGWKQVAFGSVPQIVGLDLVAGLGLSLLFYLPVAAICAVCLIEFGRITGGFTWTARRKTVDRGEGFDREEMPRAPARTRFRWRDARWYQMLVAFVVTALYVPLSKISIDALVWSSDFWPVENPYLLTDSPIVNATVPGYRADLDFCYTTTMRTDEMNGAFFILPFAVLSVFVLTLSLPIRLWTAVRAAVPRIDPYTELGEKRHEIDAEYRRLLERDRNSFAFLYIGYRRPWASFKAIMLCIKLLGVATITVLSKDNCIFRHVSRQRMNVFRQAAMITIMSLLLVGQLLTRPYIDRISNGSELVSRIVYVTSAFLGLLAALEVAGSSALDGPVLLTIMAIGYGMNIYFVIISTDLAQRIVKRMQRRLDESIDLFSPDVDLSKHIARRVWQETLSTTLLTQPAYRMPVDGQIVMAETANAPPYLLGFRGTQAERLIESIRILREVGMAAYSRAVLETISPLAARLRELRRIIMADMTGPDSFWCPPANATALRGVSSFFGRAYVVPFPFTVVFIYDQRQDQVVFSSEADLELYVAQNTSEVVEQARRVRLALRALEGCDVFAPFTQTQLVGRRGGNLWQPRGVPHVQLSTMITYTTARVRIERNSSIFWRGSNMSSGFRLTFIYTDGRGIDHSGHSVSGRKTVRDAAMLGLDDTFAMSPELARIFRDNRVLLEARLGPTAKRLTDHRDFYRMEATDKTVALSYGFLLHVSGNDTLSPEELAETLETTELASSMRSLVTSYPATITLLHARMRTVNRNRVTKWWYVLWDDLWRRNHTTVGAMSKAPHDFSPHYRHSICYRPLPRAQLEAFLAEHGLWTPDAITPCWIGVGFLNRVYFYLDSIAFEKTSDAITIRVGHERVQTEFEALSTAAATIATRQKHRLHLAQPSAGSALQPSTIFTGDGTADDEVIRPRDAFAFESFYDRPHATWHSDPRGKMAEVKKSCMTWLGLLPVPHRASAAPGVWLDLRQHKRTGTFVLPHSRAATRALEDDVLLNGSTALLGRSTSSLIEKSFRGA